MPLLMPFLINHLSTLFYEGDFEAEALIPSWSDGTREVTFYEAKPLRKALAENERKLSCIAKHLDYGTVGVEQLPRRVSFFKVRNSFDLKFAGESLKK